MDQATLIDIFQDSDWHICEEDHTLEVKQDGETIVYHLEETCTGCGHKGVVREYPGSPDTRLCSTCWYDRMKAEKAAGKQPCGFCMFPKEVNEGVS